MNTRRSDAEIEATARNLIEHRSERRTRAPLSDEGALDLEDAYRIQAVITSVRVQRGERIAGWKLGYTSLAMRQQMGVDAPNFGPLTDVMMLASGDQLPDTVIQPRVEPEIGMRFEVDLVAPQSIENVLAAATPFACLEIVDSVFTDYRFQLEDNTADGSSAAHVVVGAPLPLGTDLAAVAVELILNGSVVATATGAAASGHPATGVLWLAEQLAAQGRRIRAGDIVITGGLTAAFALAPGDQILASFDGQTRVATYR